MSKGEFPSFLSSKATLFSNFTRIDLMVMGIGFLILSKFKLGAIPSILINIVILFLFRTIQSILPVGFFRLLNDDRYGQWSYKLGGVDEK